MNLQRVQWLSSARINQLSPKKSLQCKFCLISYWQSCFCICQCTRSHTLRSDILQALVDDLLELRHSGVTAPGQSKCTAQPNSFPLGMLCQKLEWYTNLNSETEWISIRIIIDRSISILSTCIQPRKKPTHRTLDPLHGAQNLASPQGSDWTCPRRRTPWSIPLQLPRLPKPVQVYTIKLDRSIYDTLTTCSKKKKWTYIEANYVKTTVFVIALRNSP